MIPAKRLPAQPARWQDLWRDAITDPRELLDLLGLSHCADDLLAHRDTGFPMRVPRGFVARMRRGDPADPLLLQVLPQAAELVEVAGFHARCGRRYRRAQRRAACCTSTKAARC